MLLRNTVVSLKCKSLNVVDVSVVTPEYELVENSLVSGVLAEIDMLTG